MIRIFSADEQRTYALARGGPPPRRRWTAASHVLYTYNNMHYSILVLLCIIIIWNYSPAVRFIILISSSSQWCSHNITVIDGGQSSDGLSSGGRCSSPVTTLFTDKNYYTQTRRPVKQYYRIFLLWLLLCRAIEMIILCAPHVSNVSPGVYGN